jgi:hypothetical protein
MYNFPLLEDRDGTRAGVHSGQTDGVLARLPSHPSLTMQGCWMARWSLAKTLLIGRKLVPEARARPTRCSDLTAV